MRSTKSVSSIAYHRPEVFGRLTDNLRAADVIGPALWIAHKGEGGDKPHIHLVLIGGFKTYDTSKVGSLWGFDIVGDDKGSVSALWRVTRNISDWLLYGVHDAKYLATKGLEREHAYSWADVRCSAGDEEIREQLISEAKDYANSLGDKTTSRLIMLAKRGWDWRRVVVSGLVPMGQLSQASKAWEYIAATYYPQPIDIKGEEVATDEA